MRSYPVCPKSEAPKAVSRLCGEGKKGGAEEGDLPMSSAACISLGPTPLSHLKNAEKGASLSLASVRGAGFRPSPGAPLFLRIPSRPSRRKPSPRRTSVRRFSPVMEWQDCSSEIEVDVPCSVAYDCYSDRQMIPKWMPFISSVKVLQDKPDLSRWALKYEVFGRDVEFSWLARNLQLTVSYEIPEILIPVASVTMQISKLLEASRFSSRGFIVLNGFRSHESEKEARRRPLFFVFLSFFLSLRVRFRLPTKKRSPRNHTLGLGLGPGSGERWRWKQRPRLRDQHRLGKVPLFSPSLVTFSFSCTTQF
ncbi:Polyketide cyclase / dehydrase and lipid transport [Musa troglodytarum]|uniref:Polyketide cyclase / dehydrase and lipid transport n=1 Tax=Musa troglodytarum TaxID=320322 RepID=A0A9E7FZI4_9LILI|nr:Polyketide cyclase / dehydrase and lipid transport [Musa troglodytarum]